MSTLRLAIIGDGKMGRAIADLSRERGFDVTAMLGAADNHDARAVTRERLGDADVVIEFTEPEAAPANIVAAARAGYPVVTGTTGWANRLDEVSSAVTASNGALVHAPNFSVGVNLFLAMAATVGRIMRSAPEFDGHIVETHHAAKKDAPSGTALQIKAGMQGEGYTRPIDVSSTRAGSIPGTHTVGFDGPSETITLTHSVRDRAVFARGALEAARWIQGRRGWFTMRDMLDPDPED